MGVVAQMYAGAAKCGVRLKEIRKTHQWTLKDVGNLTGFTAQQIYYVEQGEIDTPRETLAKITQALGVSLSEVVSDAWQDARQTDQGGGIVKNYIARMSARERASIARFLEAMLDEIKSVTTN